MRETRVEEKERILVVDDDLGFLQVAQAILKAKGYSVETAPSAEEALARVGERFYHVAVLDISLPDIQGTDLLSQLLEKSPDTLAIMLTGYSSVQNAVQSLNRGAFAYLEKPLDPERLLAIISRGLEKQRLVFENRRLVEELEQRNRETSILLSVSRAVSQSLDLEHIIASALEMVVPAVEAEAGLVHLRKNGSLNLYGYHGATAQLAEGMRVIHINGDILSAIYQRAEPVCLNVNEGPVPGLTPLAQAGYRAFAGVPLTAPGGSLGVMSVARRAARPFTAREIEVLTGIGRELSIAVRNAQLYEEASSARALRELDALRTEFLANVSHELRTPLAAIKGFASSLLQPDITFDEGTRREFLQIIDKEADRLHHMIKDLLLMSRLEAGALEVKKERRSLGEVVNSVKDRLSSLTVRHRFKVLIPRELPWVYVDEGRIGEVLTNLVENAVKFTPEGKLITMEARSNGGKEVTVIVSDEGIGIPREFQSKIFERFWQVKDASGGKKRGTGLGLSICRGIIEAHQGRIWLESEPGKGSCFFFSLPVCGKGGSRE
ncbi:MAG: ATP-binding protein [Chloroflexota bacterium]